MSDLVPSDSSTLAVAKRRARRRARQGGAVVFIVAMTIGVLVSLGAFALLSASTEIKSAGYERQALQTHYLAEYGMVAAAQQVDPRFINGIMSNISKPGALSANSVGDYDPAAPRNHCVSLESVPTTASIPSRSCKIFRMKDLSQQWVGLSGPLRTAALGFPSFAAPGVAGANLEGNFSVEFTDPQYSPSMVGSSQGTCTVTYTVTTYGQITPPLSIGVPAQVYGSASLEVGRGLMSGSGVTCGASSGS